MFRWNIEYGTFFESWRNIYQTIFGLNNDDNLLVIIMFILIVLVLIYTISGGMISVIVTDYIQFVILSIGFIFCIFFSIKTLGWNSLFTDLEILVGKGDNYQIQKIYNPLSSMGGFYISWQVVLGFVSAVIWPTSITRVLSIKSSDLVKKQYIWSSFSFLIRFIMPCF